MCVFTFVRMLDEINLIPLERVNSYSGSERGTRCVCKIDMRLVE